jgi:hypothetical protein
MIASAVASCRRLAFGHAPKPPLDDHGMEPLCELDSITGTTDSSFRGTWSSGRGAAKPKASRTTISSSRVMPVLLLSSWKVVPLNPANRSNAGTSR